MNKIIIKRYDSKFFPWAGFVYAIQSGKLSLCGGTFEGLVKQYNKMGA